MALASKGANTRANIIDRAKQLFYQRGYDGTSFTDIVQATGLHRGNIYHYFKTKDEILQAVIDSRLAEFSALLDAWERERTDPRDRILALVEMVTGRNADLVRYGCPIGSLNTELGKDRLEMQTAARVLFELFRRWLAQRFEELGQGERADALALHLLGRAQGIAVISHVYRDAELLRRETAALADWVRQLGDPADGD